MKNKTLISLVILTLIGLVLYSLGAILEPFILAFVLCYITNPLFSNLCKKMPSSISAIVIVVLVISIFLSVVFLILPILHETFSELVYQISYNKEKIAITEIEDKIRHMGFIKNPELFLNKIISSIESSVTWISENLFKTVMVSGFAIFHIFYLIFLTPFVMFHTIFKWEVIINSTRDFMVRHFPNLDLEIFQEVDLKLRNYLKGQLTISAILITFYSSLFYIMGLNHSIALGIIAGISIFVPYIGIITAFVLTIIMAFFQFSQYTDLFYVVLIFGVGQLLEGFYLTPNLLGKFLGIHPVFIVLCVLSGAKLFGFVGMLTGVPIGTIILTTIEYFYKKGYKNGVF